MKSNIKEILMTIGLLIILFILLNPMIYYSNMVLVSTITLLILFFILFSIFVWKDKTNDEREELHQSLAGRVAFLSGSFVIIIGIIIQSFTHMIDKWLIFALIVMIVSKIATLKYSERNN